MSNKIQSSEIGKIVNTVRKWNPLKSIQSEPFNYIDLSSIDQMRKLIVSTQKILPNEAPSRACKLVNEGDILVSTVRPNLNGVAYVPRELDGATASTGFCVLRPKEKELNGRYLFYWVQTSKFINEMVKFSKGANYPAISDSVVKGSLIPLPPLTEQERIAEILDKASAIRRERRWAIQLADEFLRSVFLDMFGDPIINPNVWKTRTLNEICKKITDGTHDTPKRLESGAPFITGKHIKPFFIDFGSCDFVSQKDHKEIIKRCNPRYGDILYTNIGVNVGTAAFNHWNKEFSMKNVALLKPDNDQILPRYLEFLLNHQGMKNKILGGSSVGGAQKFLSLSQINRIEIPLPIISIQRRFEKIVSKTSNYKNNQRDAEKLSDDFFISLTQHAFRGEL